jgi:class 3 adenylate cyclase/predicted ATPase
MQRIVNWLNKLGLGQYAQRFADNDIDANVLRDLTDHDLEKIGVSLGHRKKILRAIAELDDARSGPEPARRDEAERRQLTVMFADLVGSTQLSARMDPEDLREVIWTYQKAVAEIVRRFDGFVAKYMGDGVLVYFGYPQAHEDDTERAVRTGLAVVNTVSNLQGRERQQVRIGIATGLVVVGDLAGEGEAQERAVVGDAPNLAARLQALAEPGQVLISDSIRQLTAGLFKYRDLGLVALKGLSGPIHAWQVIAESTIPSRFEARHETGLTPLVGREEELELLLRRWRRAASGEGRVVLLSGEPGIGKSRLTEALQVQLRNEPHTRLRFFCSPHHSDSAFYPAITHLERAAGLERHDTPDTKLAKLVALLGPSPGRENDVPLLAELLSIPTADRYAPLSWSPLRKKQKVFEALLTQLERLSRQRPVLAVYEDVHWIDPSSCELLDAMVERAARLSALLVITFRLEFQPPWIGQAHVSAVNLGRLGRREGAALVKRVAVSNILADEITEEILERTDGIPLFVEELTKAVLEASAHDDEGANTVAAALPAAFAVPATLHASLMARLDRLGPSAKQTAQIGAAIGREFSYELLALVAQKNDADLRAACGRLSDAGLVFCRGTPPQATFLFKHALVRDAAYASLLRTRRQQLNACIASTLEAHFPEIMDKQPEILARHCTEADFPTKAVGYWLKAGQQALARGAMIEAVAQLRKGLNLLSGVPESAARQKQELDLQIALGRALMATKGYATPEPGEAYARARQLCEQLNWPQQSAIVLGGQWLYHVARAELEQGEHQAEVMRHLCERSDDVSWNVAAGRISGCTCFFLGKFIEARAYLENILAKWDSTYRASTWAEDPYVSSLIYLFRTLLCLGYLDQARQRRDEALAEARRLSPDSLAFALCLVWRGDWAMEGVKSAQTMLRSADEILTISSEQGFSPWFAVGNIMRGWCLGTMGRAEEGIPLLLEGLDARRAMGAKLVMPFYLMTLAEVYGMAAQPEKGLNRLAEAAMLLETTQERWAEAEVHRLRGTLLLSMREPAEAEESLNRALAVARRQGAKFWELRAAVDLAQLRRDQSKHTEARDLLAPIYGWFTEGFDTPVLQDAKALLDQLA